MAKPTPIDPDCPEPPWLRLAIALLMPITSPLMFTSGPPELPGLIAASVWIALKTAASAWPPALSEELVRTGRFRALTMPDVTVPCRPSGDPMATTCWPTCRSADEPSFAGFRLLTPDALITARSELGSRPRISALAVLPSLNVTRSWPPLAASSTTWLLVRICPSELMITPEPSPAPPWPLTSIETTLGRTAAATWLTEPSAEDFESLPETAVPLSELTVDDELSLFSAFAVTAPTPPPIRPAARIAATTAADTLRGRRSGDPQAVGSLPGGGGSKANPSVGDSSVCVPACAAGRPGAAECGVDAVVGSSPASVLAVTPGADATPAPVAGIQPGVPDGSLSVWDRSRT